MSDILNLSVKSQKFQAIVAYFEEELGREVDGWNEARKLLKEMLYDSIDEMTEEGRKILDEREGRDSSR